MWYIKTKPRKKKAWNLEGNRLDKRDFQDDSKELPAVPTEKQPGELIAQSTVEKK